MLLKDEYIDSLAVKLDSSSDTEKDYVFQYLFRDLIARADPPLCEIPFVR